MGRQFTEAVERLNALKEAGACCGKCRHKRHTRCYESKPIKVSDDNFCWAFEWKLPLQTIVENKRRYSLPD